MTHELRSTARTAGRPGVLVTAITAAAIAMLSTPLAVDAFPAPPHTVILSTDTKPLEDDYVAIPSTGTLSGAPSGRTAAVETDPVKAEALAARMRALVLRLLFHVLPR